MSPPVIQLPLDLSGTAATNKVVAELHQIAATGNRAFPTTRGPFYTASLVVRNKTTGHVLAPGTDYIAAHMDLDASLRSGMEVCAVVLIKSTYSATEIEVDYQAIGGPYSATIEAIEQLLESLDLDNRTVHWGDILGAPEYFPPTAHFHDVGDVYGFEYVVTALLQIKHAILVGDQAAFDELRNYVDRQDAITRGMIAGFENLINEHTSRRDNPHEVSKDQVGLSNVLNYGVASTSDATTGTSNTVYMTALRTKEAITAQVGNTLNAHIARQDNPHGVTKTQVGLSNVVNYGLATNAQAVSGSGEAYMTATLTGAAITALAVNPLNAHTARQDNPHGVTKAQVNLGNVDNFLTATAQETVTGTATNLFVTPAGARALVQAMALDPLTTHVNRTDNPHGVTKAQVQLGNVENFKQVRNTSSGNAISILWTGAELQAWVDSTNMGRIHTYSQPDPSIAAHTGRTDNPHGTTKAQVGLASVLDYGMASQAESETGAINTAYMSPLRTKQAITAQAVNPLTALINQRVVTGSNGQLATLTLGSTGYLYTDGDGSVSLRVAGSRYFQFQAGGNFVVNNGRVIASGGFQPSDRRLKKDIGKIDARPLWREFDFKQWTMKESGEVQRGAIAQELQKAAPDRVTEYEHGAGRRKCTRLAVDNVGAAFEMAFAAGEEVDRLSQLVQTQGKTIVNLLKRLEALESKG